MRSNWATHFLVIVAVFQILFFAYTTVKQTKGVTNLTNKSWGDKLWNLPWIVRLLIAIFFDFICGLTRFVDGIMQGNVIKIVLGFIWIFYGLAIGWILDVIFCAINVRPFLL